MDEAQIAGIQQRFQRVMEQIAEATTRSGRMEGAVRLVVVTKSQPLEVVQAAIAAGAGILGENYAEEAVSKISTLKNAPVEWHMIGHVQSRKSVLVAGNFSMLHSLDSIKLAERLSRDCIDENRILPVLIEINVSGEETKYGFRGWDENSWSDLVAVCEKILQLPGLQLRGLMTMPPYYDDPEQTRPFFVRLRRLQAYLQKCIPQANLAEMSMGTSVDFIPAIEEGSTLVRVGTAIVGPRYLTGVHD
jgi:pyridoxal phosphate enzyme (YggS family)